MWTAHFVQKVQIVTDVSISLDVVDVPMFFILSDAVIPHIWMVAMDVSNVSCARILPIKNITFSIRHAARANTKG